jgi:ATP-dependent Clp protease protease subunit
MRASLPNSRVMVHQPSGGFQGQVTDIMIHAREVEGLKRRLNQIYEKHTGRNYDEIENALERDRFMSPEEAKEFGLIDTVMEKRALPEASS